MTIIGHSLGSAGHPRVGGEHLEYTEDYDEIDGSSPRGRGTRICPHRDRHLRGVIPAWAGNTPRSRPRVQAWSGSSPRGRGTRRRGKCQRSDTRVIPAWAGNTSASRAARMHQPGHPRVGGEHAQRSGFRLTANGSSPRGRETHAIAGSVHGVGRVIPAWAGNTRSHGLRLIFTTGHPRVGGEHQALADSHKYAAGSSPRGRGTPRPAGCAGTMSRVIPAWAGNTSRPTPAGWPGRPVSGHPRVGGEHLKSTAVASTLNGSSPRGRGTLLPAGAAQVHGRVIPAWAGNTGAGAPSTRRATGHPRVGGEHWDSVCQRCAINGSSPRGRGTQRHPACNCNGHRVIPAWAGNTPSSPSAPSAPSGHPRVGGEHICNAG